MAGKEARGVQAADANLFQSRPYVLTGSDATLEHWVAKIGARLVRLDAAEHDRLVALVSHLPQLAIDGSRVIDRRLCPKPRAWRDPRRRI